MGKRKEITIDERNDMIKIATDILHEIVQKWLPNLQERQIPKIILKFGGSTAWYGENTEYGIHKIGLNFYSFRKMNLCLRRLLLIHEFTHSLGVNHSSEKNFNTSFDLQSLFVYQKVFGDDNDLKAQFALMTENVGKIEKCVPLINQRKLIVIGDKLL